MRTETRLKFNAYLARIAEVNGVAIEDVGKNFTVAPNVSQKLEEKIKESSEFLGKINIIPVPEQQGNTLAINVTRPLASRTNTGAGNRRTPGDPTDNGLVNSYYCRKTDFDYAWKYSKLDLWAHRPEYQTLMSSAVAKQQGRDRIMIGWNGTSVAAATDRVANPMLQDVNIGWLEKIRLTAPARILESGDVDPTVKDGGGVVTHQGHLYVSDAGTLGVDTDYVNIDALANDAIELMDEWHRDDTDLVVIVGRDLVHQKFQNVINAAGDTATEMEARDRILTLPKLVGGKTAVMVPFFPADAMLITSLDNLSIYVQENGRRKMLREEPDYDQVANYESSNEDYVIEDYGRVVLVRNIVLGAKP